QVNIANTNITLANSLTANGQAQTQKVRITCGDVVLKEGTDYTLANNVAKDAGTYTMTVKGKGQYVGSVQVNYTIANAVTPTPEKKKDVHTGEQTNVGFFAALAAALAAMAAIIAFLNKKRA
ncbi:MAG: hypothetical protein KBT48_06630, partial [Firmicutes bacterium]|nr:hypothetical protein [Bacillota bacterium]